MKDVRNRRVYTDDTGRFLSATYEQYCEGTGIIIPAQQYEDMEDAAAAAGYDMTAYVLRDGQWNLEPKPDTRTASEKRQAAYSRGFVDETDWHITWGDKQYSCDELSQLGMRYAFREETSASKEIRALVEDNVAAIRAAYPDET